jgi:hypothetical protein
VSSKLQNQLEGVAAQATENAVLLFSVLGKSREAKALKALSEKEDED